MVKNITKFDKEEIQAILNRCLDILIEERKKIGKRELLAEALGVHPSTAMRLEDGTYNLTMTYFLQICKALKLDPLLVLQKAILTAAK